MTERFAHYGLTIHVEKTRIVDFRHPWKSRSKPQTFDFLSFTHYWSKSRKGGCAVLRKTSRQKYRAALKRVGQWCKKHRHRNIRTQRQELSKKLMGHYVYYGIRGNHRNLAKFCYEVHCIWQYWLNRRSRQRHGMKARRFWKLMANGLGLSPASIVHRATPYQEVLTPCP